MVLLPYTQALLSSVQDVRELTLRIHRLGGLQHRRRDPGLDYLATRLELLLSYCIDVSFYLLLKVEGGAAAARPVLSELLTTQGVMGRMRPMDVRMQHQLNQLMHLIESEDPSSMGAVEKTPRGRVEVASFDATEEELRPRPSNLIATQPRAQADEHGGAEGIYRAPKMATVQFDNGSRESEKKARRLTRLRRNLHKSEALRSVRSDVLGMPEEVAGGVGGVAGLAGDKMRELRMRDEAAQAWEEQNYVRRQVTKKDRQARKRAIALSSSLETIGDVAGDLRAVVAGEMERRC
jgi:hypothetical protein